MTTLSPKAKQIISDMITPYKDSVDEYYTELNNLTERVSNNAFLASQTDLNSLVDNLDKTEALLLAIQELIILSRPDSE
jgi:hypothetical protein